MEPYVQILSNFGFPVSVASYLLFRFEKKLDTLESTNRQLVDRVTAMALTNQQLLEKIERLEDDIVNLTKRR